jgi:hypothetical protein
VQNLPEPGVLALFSVLLVISALKTAWRRLPWGRHPIEG